jgi:uncharacterized membrane protein
MLEKTMKIWLTFITEHAAIAINSIALLVIVFGTIEALFHCLQAMFRSSAIGVAFRQGYLRYGRWLIVGLTFQLAADIIETAVSPSWDEIGRLALIAVIRTFLGYFLERDLAELTETQREQKENEEGR